LAETTAEKLDAELALKKLLDHEKQLIDALRAHHGKVQAAQLVGHGDPTPGAKPKRLPQPRQPLQMLRARPHLKPSVAPRGSPSKQARREQASSRTVRD